MSDMKLLKAEELTWDKLREEGQRGSLFFLSVAPLEDHASHLPCGTDPLICEAMAKRVAQLIPAGEAIEARGGKTHAVMLPVWHQGSSLLQSLGCLRWKAKTVTDTLVEYAQELGKIGVRRLVIITSHGALDHVKALEKAAAEIQKTTRINVLAPTGSVLHRFLMGDFMDDVEERLGRPFSEAEKKGLDGDVHAAAWETSLVLHLAPRLVEDTYRQLPPHPIFKGKRLIFKALRYHRGYFGSPAIASAELGRATFDFLTDKMAEILTEFMEQPVRHQARRKSPHRVVGAVLGLGLGWCLFRWLQTEHRATG